MTIYRVGKGGNDGNDGLSWGTRKLTWNGAEDIPVAPGDMVYIGPGVYREIHTVDVSGTAGNPISFIGDVSGEHTDGVGGIVRITGSDNDQTAARTGCVTTAGSQRNYRTFRGFKMDMGTNNDIIRNDAGGTNWTIEDCALDSPGSGRSCINAWGAGNLALVVSRCIFVGDANAGAGVNRGNGAVSADTSTTISNCIFLNTRYGITISAVSGIVIKNCSFFSRTGIEIVVALNGGDNIDVNNCIFCYEGVGVLATVVGEIIEDYNTYWANGTDRINTNVGGNSKVYPPLFSLPILHAGDPGLYGYSGYIFPWWFGELSEWSPIRAIAGISEPREDLRGVHRPSTSAKKSWGPVQFNDSVRQDDSFYAHDGVLSISLEDAGSWQIWVPVNAESTTISVWVYRGPGYTGILPRMVIKQPDQTDIVVTDTGAVQTWSQLTTTLTPSADPDFVIIELQSLNESAVGDFQVYFDELEIS